MVRDTIVKLGDGSVWRQDEYRYLYRPEAAVAAGKCRSPA